MKSLILVALLLAYVFVGANFHFNAMNGRIDPARPPWGFDLFRPELFTPEGEKLRRAAVRFYLLGGFVFVIGFMLLAA